MTSRQFRPLNVNTGTPTTESLYRRSPTRRTFKQLTGGGFIKPIPFAGDMYRMLKAESIADYEGLSTGTWSTGASGLYNGSANTSTNAIYWHQTVPEASIAGTPIILNPIRWSVDHPASNGGTFDWLARAGSTTERRVIWGSARTGFFTATTPNGQIGLATGLAMTPDMLVPGGHCIWGDGTMRIESFPRPLLAENRVGTTFDYRFRYAGFESIDSGTPANVGMSPVCKIKYLRHRVNGVAVGDLYEDVSYPSGSSSSASWAVEIAEGDSYECDVWYEVSWLPIAGGAGETKFCWYLPTTMVDNGSQAGAFNWLPLLRASNVNMSPNFNYQEETYSITISGHSGWTLKDGSDGPHKIKTEDGWTAVISSGGVSWTNPSDNGYLKAFVISWGAETASIRMKFGKAMRDLYVGSTTTMWSTWYQPTADGTMRSSIDHAIFGTVLMPPNGVFNQAGSTTFELVPWSIIVPPNASYAQAATNETTWNYPGRISGGLTPAPLMEIPTTITITKTTQ